MNIAASDDTVISILAGVEAWRGRTVSAQPAALGVVSPGHRGIDSRRWLISLDGAAPSHLLKVIEPEQARFFDVPASFAANRAAATLGCAPQVVYVDARRQAIVVELLDGWATATMDDLRKPDVLEKVVALKATIRKGAAFAGSWTVFDRLREFEDACRAATVERPDDLWWMLDAVDDIESAILAAGWDARPAHADGLASNVMIGPKGEVQLVDFDEARNVDPLYELGILLNEAFPFESEILPALELAEGSVRQASLARCRLYAVADDLMWGVWGLLMNATSKRDGIEFLKYANWRLLRCRMALRHPGFEEKLRNL